MHLQYDNEAIIYLKRKDKRLGEAIDRIGPIERRVNPDLFSSVIHHIVGQQISTAAQITVWNRLATALGVINAQNICNMEVAKLQSFGITFKKAEYIKEFAQKVHSGEFDVNALSKLDDKEVIAKLSALRGIGVWTAEMLMIFSMQRPDILSYGDLAIHRGMRMLYHHRKIDFNLFEKYRKRYSPHGTVASLYLWAIAGGALPEMKDYAPKKKQTVKHKD